MPSPWRSSFSRSVSAPYLLAVDAVEADDSVPWSTRVVGDDVVGVGRRGERQREAAAQQPPSRASFGGSGACASALRSSALWRAQGLSGPARASSDAPSAGARAVGRAPRGALGPASLLASSARPVRPWRPAAPVTSVTRAASTFVAASAMPASRRGAVPAAPEPARRAGPERRRRRAEAAASAASAVSRSSTAAAPERGHERGAVDRRRRSRWSSRRRAAAARRLGSRTMPLASTRRRVRRCVREHAQRRRPGRRVREGEQLSSPVRRHRWRRAPSRSREADRGARRR